MRTVMLTSNSPRHFYLVKQVSEHFDLCGVVIEPKRDYFFQQRESSAVISAHFKKLRDLEKNLFFLEKISNGINYLKLDTFTINDGQVLDWVRKLKPEIILIFGCGILNSSWFEIYENKILNLHLGYSPRYRGSATLFWPYYNNEPEYIGTTVHLADQKIDNGPILEIVKLDSLENLDYYLTTLSIIKLSIENFPLATKKFLSQETKPKLQSITEQKYFYKKSDFNESVLKAVLDKYEK